MVTITDACIRCCSCISNCPIGAIYEGDSQCEVAPNCNDCGACLNVCPVGAIH